MSDERLYSKSEVEAALRVVTDVTLDRVRTALIEQTYGIVQPKEHGDKTVKVKQVIDWDDACKALDELRGSDDDDEE